MGANLDDRLEISQLLLGSNEEPELLVQAGRRLAVRLHELAQDNALWDGLGDPRAAPLSKRQLGVLPLIDWPPLLREMGYQDPPSVEFVSGESVRLLRRAELTGDAGSWDLLREHLGWLAQRLGQESDQPWATMGLPARERLRRRIGQGWNVVRQLDLAKLLLGAAPSVADGVLVAFAPPPVNLTVVIGKLALNLGLSVATELSSARRRLEDETNRSELAELAASPAFSHGRAGATIAQLTTLRAILGELPSGPEFAWAEPPDMIEAILGQLDEWQSYIAAELATAWGYLAVSSPSDLETVAALTIDLTGFRRHLRDLRRDLAAGDPGHAADRTYQLEKCRSAITDSMTTLLVSLTHRFGHPHGFTL